MLVRMRDAREHFIDFREEAPQRATRDMYLDAHGNAVPQRSRRGWLAVAVPGTVLGLERARIEYGTMSRVELMAPAIRLARAAHKDALASSLSLIARDGPNAFYRGPITRAIVAASAAADGILGLDDFKRYRVYERTPLHCAYHGYRLIVAPPPSSGGVTLCEILGIIAPYDVGRYPWHGVRETHVVVEAERRSYADRNTYLADPSFVRVPVRALLAPSYLARLRGSIEPVRATPSRLVRPGAGVISKEGSETTHYSIVDSAGNAVAVTYTLNDAFGAHVSAAGVIMNDEMDDFTAKPGTPNMFGLVQGTANSIAPGKRPLSSMTPTIVTKDGKLFMVTGSPGGGHIITIVLETLLNVIDYRMNVAQSVDAPRIHMQWLPDEVDYEAGALDAPTARALRADGYSLVQKEAWGAAEAIVVRGGRLEGGSDRRLPGGAAAGYE